MTTLHFVPPMLQAFLEEPTARDCASLRHIVCSGEALVPATVAACAEQLPQAALHNLYGPTEAAIDVSAWTCDAARDRERVPIGVPIANTTLHVLDDALQPVPIGAPGELYIGGRGLARGYLGRAALTAERFVPNPFATAGQAADAHHLYRTGDLARWRTDGVLDYLGRTDHQVKLRGVRIELGEIEAALARHAAVAQCIALYREDLPGGAAIVAYVTPADPPATDLATTLAADLATTLPAAMIPGYIVVLDALPLTPNGKPDRRALPVPTTTRAGTPPASETERIVADIWQAVLGRAAIAREDHFFALGGHSLSATRVNSRLREAFALELPLRSLFEHPTLAGIADHIDALAALRAPTELPEGHHEIDLG